MGALQEQHERWMEAKARMGARAYNPKPMLLEAIRPSVVVMLGPPPADLLTVGSWRTIACLVAAKHGITFSEIRGPERSRKYVAARYEAMGIIYTHTDLTLPAIGRRFDRDHTVVIHALRKLGITLKGGGPYWNAEREAIVAKLWMENRTLRHIAETLGDATVGMVSARVIKLGLPTRSGRARTVPDWNAINARRRVKRKVAAE